MFFQNICHSITLSSVIIDNHSMKGVIDGFFIYHTSITSLSLPY